GRFMSFVLGATAVMYFGLYSVLYRYEPRTVQAQQQLQAAAAQTRASPFAEQEGGGGGRDKRFIIQRQLQGEYDARTAAYYARAPEMQMEDVEARVGGLPAGMVQEGGAGVRSSVAERRAGAGAGARGGPRRVLPSMYETAPGIPGLDESDF
ncbi:hypothetical protein TSOC_006134, partial [Tetrabaena socialis]